MTIRDRLLSGPTVTFDNVIRAGKLAAKNVAKLRGEKVPGENVFTFRAPETTLQFHGQGTGDLMIIRQVGRAFTEYLREHGDPGLGRIVVACGGFRAAFRPDPGDVNLYWWWSFGQLDDEPERYLEQYLEEVSVKPDVILCLSERCQREARQLGYDTLFLPLGTQAFQPLGLSRSGFGYAGSKRHKQDEQARIVLGPYRERPDFEWVSDFVTPAQLNAWYNTRLVTFGMTRDGQRRWGMVNNRVFETLASGTPLVLEAHPNVENVLGFEYPYQTSSRQETVDTVEEIRSNPAETVAMFDDYADRVRENHSYTRRVETMLSYLQ